MSQHRTAVDSTEGQTGREQFRPDDHPNDHFLLTTVVGSHRKPKWLDRAREQFADAETTFGERAWTEAADDAARTVVDEHERCGLDVVTDGEVRRTEMVEYFAHRIEGFEFPGRVKVWGHNTFDKPAVVDEVAYDDPWLREEFAFTSEVATRPVKVPITGPYTIAQFSFDEVYGDDETLALELADLVKREIETLVESGARYVQIDEPALAMTPDDHAIVGACLDRITADLPPDVRIGLHVCYGDYSRIYPEVLEFPIDELDVELVNGDYEQLDVFTDPAFDLELGLGVVDIHSATVETVPEIKQHIIDGLGVVPPERLVVSPDCGLKLLDRSVARRKIENMVQAAREVEAELDAGTVEVPAASVE